MSVKKAIKCYPCLRQLSQAKSYKQRSQILAKSPQIIYTVLADIAKQILNGRITVDPSIKAKLSRYKNSIRSLASSSKAIQRKRIINQQGGAILPLLIKPALTALATILANRLSK